MDIIKKIMFSLILVVSIAVLGMCASDIKFDNDRDKSIIKITKLFYLNEEESYIITDKEAIKKIIEWKNEIVNIENAIQNPILSVDTYR